MIPALVNCTLLGTPIGPQAVLLSCLYWSFVTPSSPQAIIQFSYKEPITRLNAPGTPLSGSHEAPSFNKMIKATTAKPRIIQLRNASIKRDSLSCEKSTTRQSQSCQLQQ